MNAALLIAALCLTGCAARNSQYRWCLESSVEPKIRCSKPMDKKRAELLAGLAKEKYAADGLRLRAWVVRDKGQK